MPKRYPIASPDVEEFRDINVPTTVYTGTVDQSAYLDEGGDPPDPNERIIPETSTGVLTVIDFENEDGELLWTTHSIGGWTVLPNTVQRVT